MPPLPAPPRHPAVKLLDNREFDRLRALYPKLWDDPRKDCKTCGGERTYLWWTDHTRTETAEWECHCADQWLLYLWMLSSGIDLAYQRMSWDDATAVPEDVREQIMAYALDGSANVRRGRHLLLHSPQPGNGKTLLATMLTKTLMLQGISAYFAQFNDILDFWTETWRDTDRRQEFLRRVRHVDVLVIDDLGKESGARLEQVKELLDVLLRSRVAADAVVVITTNLTREQLAERYGSFIASLVTLMLDIRITGTDYRPVHQRNLLREFELGLTRPITAV